MHPHKKFAFDVGITFIASAVTMPLASSSKLQKV